VETLSDFIIKREASRVMQRGPKVTKESIINNLVNLLHIYRQKCAAQSSPSQLILPENLKLLPMYTLTALKTPAFKLL
jgi:protein transport protein SEC24